MNTTQGLPVFDDCFSNLNQFILELVRDHEGGELQSWDDLEAKVQAYFTPQRMEEMESVVPGWQRMASYAGGITVVHVTCVFLGLFMLEEFQSLSFEQQQLAKWIVLFHDVTKFHVRGKKDTMHAFRSAVQAARSLPEFGFATTEKYRELIDPWSEYTAQAFLAENEDTARMPDNQKLPQILKGIEHLYGRQSPATLIIKTILFHISLDIDPFYPTPAPLTEQEIKNYLDADLLPLLKVMMLADNEGWSLFDPETRARQRRETLEAFDQYEHIISG